MPKDRHLMFDRVEAGVIFAMLGYSLYLKGLHVAILYCLSYTNMFCCFVSLLIRRSAVQIDMRWWVQLLSYLRLVWPLVLVWAIGGPVTPLVPLRFVEIFVIVMFVLLIYTRFSLGRSFGLIPANRKIVTTGAYAVVRHPIQGLEMMGFIAFLLAGFSLLRLAAVVMGIAIFVGKSIVEERLLLQDPEYRSYQARVRWRFVPGMV